MKIFHNEINLRLFLFQIKVTCDVNLTLGRVRVRVPRTGQDAHHGHPGLRPQEVSAAALPDQLLPPRLLLEAHNFTSTGKITFIYDYYT